MVGNPSIVKRNIGINQWDEDWQAGYYYDFDTGVKTANANWNCGRNLCGCVPNTNYYFIIKDDDAFSVVICWFDANGNFLSRSWVGWANVVTSPNNAWKFGLNITKNEYHGGSTYLNDISLNYPSTDHEYHPYWTSMLPSGIGVVDLGELNWGFYSEAFYDNIPDKVDAIQNIETILCDKYSTVAAMATMSGTDKTIWEYAHPTNNKKRICVKDTAYNGDATAFKTAMAGVLLFYKKATT